MVDFVLRIVQTSVLYHAEYVLVLEIDFLCISRQRVVWDSFDFFCSLTRFFGGSLSRTRYELGGAGKVPRTFRGWVGGGVSAGDCVFLSEPAGEWLCS